MFRNLFKRKRTAAAKPSYLPDWVVEKRKFAKSLAASLNYSPVEGEPLPSWMEHPEILIGSIGWRMGFGEAYFHDVFLPFWQNLSPEEQTAYVNKFDLGPQWQDREKWFASLERNKKR